MIKISDLINKFKKTETSEVTAPTNGVAAQQEVKQLRNWYEERYDNITVQRNLLFLLLLILLCLSIISIGVVAYVINTKRFDPFVIQIDDTTGIAKVVNPLSSSILSGNEALAQYFIKKYIIARETYNPVDFSTEAKRIVRLLSSNSIYWDYRGYLKNEAVDPTIKYGQKNTTYLVVKSWSKLADKKYIMRFSINETAGAMKVFNKIAVVEFQYLPMELTESDKDVNPVGFQVTGYRMDDDSS
ncbi:Type IV secretion system protein VirB8 [Candidatus Megaera venefica]|jgi:type IV secretion system protein VirB8|uniref:Type IV secretion system protein VirB8 n=1 Tax=Candidatus Megaera venefica TaxID=2055910 RepID=A0ABU5NAF6_9RICK|nr:VirB8/TrbF family protein [Candidatus Megaera venefica]MEA0970153.1 Type IV secretion system protein VirB8 [Candidatus Megaera venefica]